MPLKETLARHDGRIESTVQQFQVELDKIVARAQASVASQLSARLEFRAGKLLPNAHNRAVLRGTSSLLQRALREEGMQELVDSFVMQFGGQYRFFEDVLKQTVGDAEARAVMQLDADDRRYLSMMQDDASRNLTSIMDAAADSARKQVLLNMGALGPKELAARIGEALKRPAAQARTEAATATSSYYRAMSDASFRKIEEDPNWEVTYKYVGPPASDPVIREFCEDLMAKTADGQTWTRDEIDDMDNGQLDDVMVTCGGYNCRHQWIVADIRRTKGEKR